MKKEAIVLLAEDDEGHTSLIIKNLRRSGFDNRIVVFKDGQETLDFLFCEGKGPHRDDNASYLLLLDISMPKVSGVEVLQRIKEDEELKKIPVVMITTTDDPREVSRCHKLGCNGYIIKTADYQKFMEAINDLNTFTWE